MGGLFHMREEHPVEWQKERSRRAMKKVEITRRIEFDAGHRVFGHESKCANIHGHRYAALISCAPIGGLDTVGRVIDYSVVKELVGGWIDENLDHGMLLFEDDPLVEYWVGGFGSENHKHFIMDVNPTAENIAKLIFKEASDLLCAYDISVTKVVVYETPNCSAEYGQ